MNFKDYSHQQVDQHLKILAKKEREILHDVLVTVKEVAQRKFYTEKYASLFLYLTEEIGYSNGSAQRRIDAAELLVAVPEMGEKVKSGEITLNKISLVSKVVRQVYKETKQEVTATEKAEILEQICDLKDHESQQEIAAFFEIPVIEKTKIKIQSDGSWIAEVRIPKELVQEISYAQSLLSHALPTKELVDYIEYLTKRLIKEKTSVRKSKKLEDPVPYGSANVKTKQSDVKIKQASTNTARPEANDPKTKTSAPPFSARQRKILMQEQKCCQHLDPVTRKQCRSTWFLQADHKKSRWAGGESTLENGQILCAFHNRQKYRKEAGIEFN